MIIDTHIHTFPDNIAHQIMNHLKSLSDMKSYGNGTTQSAIKFMDEDHIHISVNLPIATRADQVMKINRRIIQQKDEQSRIINFGTMHPGFKQYGNVDEEIQFLSEKGIKGIKLHPEFQEFYPDDDTMLPIYEACAKYDMIMYFHSGYDEAFTDVHGTPQRFSQVRHIDTDMKIVLAHMGGYRMWDEVERYLMGMHEVYFDTSYCVEMEEWQMKEIIFGHGAYKILFASDMPWERPLHLINKIKKLDLGPLYEKMIFHMNAEKLLNIN